jgi:hypothetical protein
MDVNDDAGNLIPHGVLRFFASRLAPTGGESVMRGLSRIATDVTALKKKS